jgi:hypothetical protein
VDGEHDAITEPVVALARFARDDEAGRLERRVVIAGKHRCQRLPGIRRVADTEPRGNGPREAARLEVFDRVRRLLQLATIELCRLQCDSGKVESLLAPVSLAGPVDAGHDETGLAGELLDGVGEALAPVLDQEADCGAVSATPEAVVELLGRAHGERRRFLAVERAARLVVSARFFERDVPIDNVDDVDTGQQRLDEIVRNHVLDAALA